MDDSSYLRFGGVCAILAALASVGAATALYLSQAGGDAASEMVAGRIEAPVANWLLAASGLLATAAVVAVYFRVRDSGPAWATWAAAVGFLGSSLMGIHALWDALRWRPLSELAKQGETYEVAVRTLSYVPNAADPRGVGSFLLTGLFFLVVGVLIARSGTMPQLLGQLGIVEGVLLILLFSVRLSVPLRTLPYLETGLAAVAVGALGPLWWLLAGRELLQSPATEPGQAD